jgi:hypothetical protein
MISQVTIFSIYHYLTHGTMKYLFTFKNKNVVPISLVMDVYISITKFLIISSLDMFFIDNSLILFFIGASHMRNRNEFSMITTMTLAMNIYQEWPLLKIYYVHATFSLPFSRLHSCN